MSEEPLHAFGVGENPAVEKARIPAQQHIADVEDDVHGLLRRNGNAPHPASRIASASIRSTETSCDTPRSIMVTPNSRCMRAMVSA